MRKIYALMVLLFAVLQLPAQVLVQGRPHPTAKPQMVSPRAIADGTFTMDMIENWSGEGANRAAFVVQWNAESETSALVWGFRWDGEATGETMARAIAASDPRFFIMTETGTAYGSTVSGFGYDVNKSGDFSITKDGVTLSPDENGVIFSSSYGYDGWTCTDPEDYWQSGWYQGYWSYWLKSNDSDAWGYSGTGITGRKLTDGCWDGWNFSVNMSPQSWKPLAPAPKNGPTAPSVKVQPEDVTVSPGESVTFAPEFKGDSLYFQWYKDEVAIQDAEASSYSIVSAETSDAGRYYCVVSNMLDTISTDTVTLVVGDKSVIAAPGEEPGTALVVYDDSYASFSGILTIPPTILIEGESYTVVGIDDMAFMGCAKLTSVTFPSTLKTIGDYAFAETAVKSVVLPDGVSTLGNYAFNKCASLATVSLGNSLTAIGDYAFSDCKKLESVTFGSALETIGERAFASAKISSLVLPATVRTIGDWAFYNNPLTAITFNDGLQSIGSRAFYGVSVQTLNIPNSVTELGSYAFSGCKSLETVTIGTGVTKISDYTFNTCSALTQISCPSVTEIGASAFKGCSSLTDIPLNDKITSLGNYVFSGCSAIESLVIPNSVTSIGSYAFEKCTKLTSATLGTGISSIPDYMFSSCSALTSVVLPENITGIGNSAFYNCKGLKSLPVTESITSIGTNAFYGCTSLTSVNLSDKVTSLGALAFYGCSSLTEAVLGTGITTLGSSLFCNDAKLKKVVANGKIASVSTYTFNGCSSLERIYINNTPPTGASSNTFTKVPTTCRIYVPAQTCQFYAQTTYWKDFVIMPWLDELEIVSTTPSMSFDGEEALDVKPDTKTFVIEFNRTVVNTDSVSAMLIRSGFPVEDQELTVSYSGNEVTVIREGEDLPNDPYYYLVLTTSDKQFSILFKVTTATGIDDLAVEKEVRLREYYSVDGKLLPCSVEGINIVKTVYEDGSIEVSKVYVKPEDCRR